MKKILFAMTMAIAIAASGQKTDTTKSPYTLIESWGDTSVFDNGRLPLRILFDTSTTFTFSIFVLYDDKNGKLTMNRDSSITILGDTMALIKRLCYYFLKQSEDVNEKRDVIEASAKFYNAVPCKQRLNPFLKPYMNALKKQGYKQEPECKVTVK